MIGNIQIRKHLSSFQIIFLGFATVILLGAILLMLPISSKDGVITPFNEALFTSTSAVCVTGLIVNDTASYWSVIGQAVILLLIQIGGLGVVTIAAMIASLSGRKISLMQRSTMQEAISAPKVGGIVRLTCFIVKATLLLEFLGFLVLLPTFVRDFGVRGIWMALFHSVSAFCNAGFDLMGTVERPFVSMVSYAGNISVSLTLALLIIVGGIGFLTWDDIHTHKHHIKKYRMQSKVILVMTGLLIVLPAIYFFVFEYENLALKDRIICSFFQAVTPRTAGFNTTDLSVFSGAGQYIMIILMLIGGSPGSTAGGLKTTTIAVLFSNTFSVFRRKNEVDFYGRRIGTDVIQNAATLLMMYLILFLSGALFISTIEGLPMDICLFETASAVGTVGLTLGLTPSLGIWSQCVLIVLMFLGRVGGLTIIYAAFTNSGRNFSKMPQEKITVG